ncbi:MAG: thioredoxin domain-containing protein, partial [Pseudomonadota bacterium]
DWVDTAASAFDFVTTNMIENGRLQHAWRKGRCNAPGTANDYANIIWAAIRLYQATAEPRFLEQAEALTQTLNTHHWLPTEQRYATSADDTSDVIVRLATGTDDAVPNANGIMVSNLASLTLITGNLDYVQQGATIVDSFGPEMASNLIAYTGLLAAEYDLSRPQIVAVFTPEEQGSTEDNNPTSFREAVNSVALPGALEFSFVGAPDNLPPALRGKAPVDDKPTAYICIGPQCSMPITDPQDLAGQLPALRKQPDKQQIRSSQKDVGNESS